MNEKGSTSNTVVQMTCITPFGKAPPRGFPWKCMWFTIQALERNSPLGLHHRVLWIQNDRAKPKETSLYT